jgi:hypothetical protein
VVASEDVTVIVSVGWKTDRIFFPRVVQVGESQNSLAVSSLSFKEEKLS